MAKTVKQRIVSRIYSHGRGWAFTPKDFLNDFNRWEISNSLEDLEHESIIRRIIRGLYDYPPYSEILKKQTAPDISKVADAIARKFNWRIQPSGETALNILGLSNQIQSQYVYLSDGPSKKYDILGQELTFKHTKLKEASIKDIPTILVVQAIKAVGKDNITREFLNNLKSKYTEKEWLKIKKNSTKTVLWVLDLINKIVEDNLC